ncbi:hypothetical protein Lesp02_75890 [Lentzea sp. NBRC 105346]|uniref:hypothetical protein n=1 Tax=Lentzea sp. NBRC 105346 TaxID=3032205 RepID=UPI0024A06D17|nr:hypothetical protein [Lentzea sp. NBRC 105346]GLZ35402.1 hypothetical protein Lesp02_75890 [Lentzea sp. NBRC 105346]
MGGAVGIVFGLCVLSFTAGAALMYVVMRRREEPQAGLSQPVAEPAPPAEEQLELRWQDVEIEYDSKPIHRNPVVGMQPEPDVEAEPVEPEVEVEPEVVAEVEPEPEPEPEPQPVEEAKPVLPVQHEFRERYLRTFEAARRRASASDN